MASKLFVGCLPYSKTEADILPVFSQFGEVLEVAVLHGKGAAFVTFTSEESATQAATYLQGYMFEGSNRGINVSFAQSRGGGGGGGGGGQAAAAAGHGRPAQAQPQPPPPAGLPPGSKGGKGWEPQPQVVPPPPVTPYPFAHADEYAQPEEPANQDAETKTHLRHELAVLKKQQEGVGSVFDDQGFVDPGLKLFIGQLPYSRTEEDLLSLFGSIGPVAEVVVLRDRQTGEKKGAAFVRFESSQHAADAMASLDGFVFQGATRPITVNVADGAAEHMLGMEAPAPQAPQAKRSFQAMNGGNLNAQGAVGTPAGNEAKLFVGQLPYSRTEQDLQELFGRYGQLVEVMLHRDARGQKKGGAFVRFVSAESAAQALECDGYLFPGSTRAISVNYAGGQKRQRLM